MVERLLRSLASGSGGPDVDLEDEKRVIALFGRLLLRLFASSAGEKSVSSIQNRRRGGSPHVVGAAPRALLIIMACHGDSITDTTMPFSLLGTKNSSKISATFLSPRVFILSFLLSAGH